MKNISKWVLILWSILCFIGICWGIMSVAGLSSSTANEYESAGQAIGLGCGMGIWFVIWIALAGPALAIYVVSGKKEATQVEIIQRPLPQTKLCQECGKYYEGQHRFCPNCGKEINPTKTALSNQANTNALAPTAVPSKPESSIRLCPKCGVPMEIKVANQGAQQGKSFYVCPNYKQCQQVFPLG
jgi:ribosomal protein L32